MSLALKYHMSMWCFIQLKYIQKTKSEVNKERCVAHIIAILSTTPQTYGPGSSV
jgi:hypothetical protein